MYHSYFCTSARRLKHSSFASAKLSQKQPMFWPMCEVNNTDAYAPLISSIQKRVVKGGLVSKCDPQRETDVKGVRFQRVSLLS